MVNLGRSGRTRNNYAALCYWINLPRGDDFMTQPEKIEEEEEQLDLLDILYYIITGLTIAFVIGVLIYLAITGQII